MSGFSRRAFLAATAGIAALGFSSSADAAVNNGKVGFSPGGGFPWLSDADLAADLDLMVQGGATWVRLDFPRASIHTAPTAYSWANTDRVLAACAKRGLKVLALVFGSPSWDRPSGTTDKYGPDTAARRANFAAFCTATAKRYGTSSVAAWEVWNEPNIPIFWQPKPNVNDYATLLVAASAAFRAVRTTQPILTGGTSPAVQNPTSTSYPTYSPTSWLTSLYAAGARSSFDAVAHHPYHYPNLRTDGNASWNAYQQIPVLRQTMLSNGDAAKKVWLTELGAPTGTDPTACSEALQSKIVNDDIGYAIRTWNYLGVAFCYSLRDSGTNKADREQNFGLVRSDRTLKAAASPFPNLAFLTPST